MNKKIAIVVSSPSTLTSFMINHIQFLSKIYDVYVLANFNGSSDYPKIQGVTKFIDIKINRKITLSSDLKALLKLIFIFRKYKFQSVHSITPKAGLLTMIAAFLSMVPNRFHTFTGQVWATKKGFFRLFLKTLDNIIFNCSTFSLVDSFSQRDFLISESVITKAKSAVLGHGSISGVNLNRFSKNLKDRKIVRNKFGIDDKDFVFLFIGRLCFDKGVDELLIAFKNTFSRMANVHLLLVGPNEGIYTDEYLSSLNITNLHYAGCTNKPEQFYSSADVFVLPSHREGFGTVILEAAACELPSVASNIYGLNDAVINHETGLLHKSGDVDDIGKKLVTIFEIQDLRNQLAHAAHTRVSKFFSEEYLSQLLILFYKSNLK